MDVGISTSSLGKVGKLVSIQELAMMQTSDHVSLAGSNVNFNVEGVSWSNGCMNLLDHKISSKGLGVKM
jgi:hypothetical protein